MTDHSYGPGLSLSINTGQEGNDQLGWGWKPLNNGKPIVRGAAPNEKIRFADIDGNGRADYIVIDPKDGGMREWLNVGPTSSNETAGNSRTKVESLTVALVLGTTFDWQMLMAMAYVEAKYDLQRRPEEILFHDVNDPAWVEGGEYTGSVGTAGNNTRFAKLSLTGRASLIAVDRSNNAIATCLNGLTERPLEGSVPKGHCDLAGNYFRGSQNSADDPDDAKYPTLMNEINTLYGHKCVCIPGCPISYAG
ncbi:hypothetical protein NM208_g8242 [Fusarium decemcellulare]|uniref:Uncharacterized protein n=1 Tax=Fusarium decemcellulare TaxID=57161 RepID=A0ACC1S667_9HYPO|nr:hypothetical protein NM208_g8242 [Fusarium decemcellulare]